MTLAPEALPIDELRRRVEQDPQNPGPHIMLAEALSHAGDRGGAVSEFKTAASQLCGGGWYDDAIKVLERLLHHERGGEQAKLCAALYLTRGQPQDGMQALAKLQIAFQHAPRDPDTLSMLASAFHAIGQPAKAVGVSRELASVMQTAGDSLAPFAPGDETRVLEPAHYLLFGARLFSLKQEALARIGAPRPQVILMATGLRISYSIATCEGGHYHHVSVSFGGSTPRAVGSSYLLFFAAALGVPWRAAAFGVSDSSVHHAHFRTISLADFTQTPVKIPPIYALLAEARSAPIEWKHVALDR